MIQWLRFFKNDCRPALSAGRAALVLAVFTAAIAATVPLQSVQAAELAGKKFDETLQLGGSSLVLNGVGLRRAYLFRFYVAGLYVPHKSSSVSDLVVQRGAKRLALRMLRDVGARTFVEALDKGFNANSTQEQLVALKTRIGQFREIIKALGTAKEDDAIDLDYLPDAGTRVIINGTQHGESIPGRDFYEALLRIYLGENPVDEDLKKGLLGLKR